MKQMKFIILFSLLLSLCEAQKTVSNKITEGRFVCYYRHSTEVEKLILNSDDSFLFNSYKTKCNGQWKDIGMNTILIQCNPPINAIEAIVGGYMSLREREIKVLSKNKLKMPITNDVYRNHVILTRE